MFTNGKVLTALVVESKRLADAIKEGKLQARANLKAVAPQFRPVLEAMNTMAVAFVAPIKFAERARVSAESSQSLASGAQEQSSSVEQMDRGIEPSRRRGGATQRRDGQVVAGDYQRGGSHGRQDRRDRRRHSPAGFQP